MAININCNGNNLNVNENNAKENNAKDEGPREERIAKFCYRHLKCPSDVAKFRHHLAEFVPTIDEGPSSIYQLVKDLRTKLRESSPQIYGAFTSYKRLISQQAGDKKTGDKNTGHKTQRRKPWPKPKRWKNNNRHTNRLMETRNPRKRNREKDESNKVIATPPAKKRRMSSQKKKSRSKDLTKWTVKDLKRYLKQNGVTFQMNKDKAYYVRLATVNRNEPNETEQKAMTDSSETANRTVLSENDSTQNIDGNSSNSESSNSPNFEVPRRSTPPLPPTINRTPLTHDDAVSDDGLQSNAPPVRREFIATPQSAKSRPTLHRVTPANDMRVHNEQNVETAAVTRRLGPFQDIPSVLNFNPSFKRIQSNLFRLRNIKVRSGNKSKYFTFLCIAIALILMTLCIPYVMTLFVAAPFCDSDSDSVSGTYSVFYGMIPLQNKMDCVLCPVNATCAGDGSARCADGYRLDDYNKICLAEDDDIASAASHIAHTASVLLGKQLGKYECAWRDTSVEKGMSEDELKQHSRDIARKYVIENKVDKGDASENNVDKGDECKSIESLSNDTDDDSFCNESDEIVKAKNENNVELFVDSSWNYANSILKDAYAANIDINVDNKTYSSLREIPSSMKCKMVLLYRYYSEYFEENSNGICFHCNCGDDVSIVIVAMMIIVYLRKVSNDSYLDNEAINAANIVLQKLSQQQTFHFSIDQFKHYTMRNCNISQKTWNRTVKYVNESTQIATIPEEIDGETRMCWKWKSPVPFVPLC